MCPPSGKFCDLSDNPTKNCDILCLEECPESECKRCPPTGNWCDFTDTPTIECDDACEPEKTTACTDNHDN